MVRECKATYFLGENPPVGFVTCDAVEGIEEKVEEVEENEQEKENEEEEVRRR